MLRKHFFKDLSAYCHGELPVLRQHEVAAHLLVCPSCRKQYEEIRLGVELAGHLRPVEAPPDLWAQIEGQVEHGLERVGGQRSRQPSGMGRPLWLSGAAAVLLVAASAGVLIVGLNRNRLLDPDPGTAGGWDVSRLEGAPKIGSRPIGKAGRLGVGQSLITDAASRARLKVADIGQLDVDPSTRLELIETGAARHRLGLQLGTIHASVTAPPRLFVVETPSAVAVDLGCAYTLSVDSGGAGFLQVKVGWVALEDGGRESFVPAGAACATRPGAGPGTPFFASAPEAFRRALWIFDFEGGGGEALKVVLREARRKDSLTLWHLLPRVPTSAEREGVFDALAALCPPPEGVTRDAVIALDEVLLERWKDDLRRFW